MLIDVPKEPPPPQRDGHASDGSERWITRWRADPDPHTGGRHQHAARFYGPRETAMREYRRWLKAWRADPAMQNPRHRPGQLVGDIADAYLAWAERTYRKRGEPTSYVHNCRSALQRLSDALGHLAGDNLTAPALARLRDQWDAAGAARRETINLWLGVVRKAWDWAAEQGYVEPDVALRLRTVSRLQRGRSQAPEYEDVAPVAWQTVEATLPELSPVVAAMIRMLWHTGMRPDEACSMRPADIDMSGDVWLYRPAGHKTEHRGKSRIVAIGPQARAELEPWLSPAAQRPIFRPSMAPGAKSPQRDQYDANSLRRAVHRACDRVFPPPAELTRIYVASQGRKRWRLETEAEWRTRLGAEGAVRLDQWVAINRWNPGQLRHARATHLRRTHGIEAARLALGHADAGVTHIYAERDIEAMVRIARETG